MHAAMFSWSVKYSPSRPPVSLGEKIWRIRKEIRVREILHTCRPRPRFIIEEIIYADQMEELYGTLADLKQQQVVVDPLEEWCESHPADDECQIHDN